LFDSSSSLFFQEPLEELYLYLWLDNNNTTTTLFANRAAAATTDGVAAARRDREKRRMYGQLEPNGNPFIPFSVETYSRLGKPVSIFFRQLGLEAKEAGR
jgi:hypothetical protein